MPTPQVAAMLMKKKDMPWRRYMMHMHFAIYACHAHMQESYAESFCMAWHMHGHRQPRCLQGCRFERNACVLFLWLFCFHAIGRLASEGSSPHAACLLCFSACQLHVFPHMPNALFHFSYVTQACLLHAFFLFDFLFFF